MSDNANPPPDDPGKKGFFESLKDSFRPLGDSEQIKKSQGMTKFFVAINRGNADEIKEMIKKQGFDPDCYNLGGMGALHQAVILGKADIVGLLLDLGATPDLPARSMDCITPMALAVEKGRADLVRLLAENGADIYRKGASGWTYIHQATEKNDPDMIRALIACGLDPCVASEGSATPLEMAVARTKREAVDALLSDPRVAQQALDDKTGALAIKIAERGDFELTRLFIKAGFPVNYRDNKGVSLLHIAAIEGDAAMVKMLVTAGADIDKAVSELGNTPLHAAALSAHPDGNEALSFLLACGADAGKRNGRGHTPLHMAFLGRLTRVKSLLMLIEAMIDVNIFDNDGFAPLHLLAEKGGGQEVAQALVSKGADVNGRHGKSGETPLHMAARNDNAWLTGFLLCRGGDPLLKDAAGLTSLALARQKNNPAVIAQLEKAVDSARAEKFLRAKGRRHEG